MRVAVDAMGGDRGPSAVVDGAVEFFRGGAPEVSRGVSLTVVGDTSVLEPLLARAGAGRYRIELAHASQVIGMDEHPAEALKAKPDSSVMVMAGLQKSGRVDAMAGPGNTGAMMAASLFALGRLEGVSRPAIAATFPTLGNPAVVLDVGANVGCKPEHLRQFALMGSAYSRGVFGIGRPRVALLNVGAERTKGSPVEQQTYDLLSDGPPGIEFIGNIEGDGILKGEADVVVCDGFVGNVILKFTESISHLIGGALYSEMISHWSSRAGFLLMRPAFSTLWKRLDSAEYGGAPLLGLNGVSIIAHGNSGPQAIKNAIAAACGFFRSGVNRMIGEGLGGMSALQGVSQ
ncbi:MAG: phosphate acyltransferase PlsX [Candidatus Fermentibacter sp.]|nr:phosphate acyltransferase PlsX [Candidatus Fermentibacter sp.]